MPIGKVFAERKTIRRLLTDPLPPKQVAAILEAARSAPSAGNLQAYNIVAVTRPSPEQEAMDPKKAALHRSVVRACRSQRVVMNAPLLLVFTADPEKSKKKYGDMGKNLYAVQDATIAASYAELAADAMGLGCTWVGGVDEGVLRDPASLRLKEGDTVVAVLAIGYPQPEQPKKVRSRRPLREIVRKWH